MRTLPKTRGRRIVAAALADDRQMITVEDDGVGFDLSKAGQDEDHIGL